MTSTKHARLSAFFIPFTLSMVSFAAGLDRSKPPTPAPAPVIQMGEYQSFELDNGLKIFVVENKKLPTLTISLLVDWDPILEKDHAGYIQMAGNMLRRGTTNRSKDQIDDAVDFIGATLSTSPTGISGRSLKKHGEGLFEIIADLLQNADFKSEELEKVRKQTLSNLQSSMDSPDAIMGNLRNALLYGPDHPYGEITSEASIKSVTTAHLKKFYQENFLPNISYLALVGDINQAEARAWAEKYLSSWKRGEAIVRNYPKPQRAEKRQVAIVDKAGAVQTVLHLANIIELKPGSADAIKARVTNILLGGPSFRLFLNLREDKGYTYGAFALFDADPVIGEFRAYAKVRNEVTKDATKEFLFELNRIRDEAVSEEELKTAKNYTSGDFARRLESSNTIARYAINIARYNLAPDYYQNYLKELSELTMADIQAISRKYIHPDQNFILAVGKADELEESLAEFGEITRYDAYGRAIDTAALAIPEGVTAETVLGKYIQALGGADQLAKIKDISVKGKMSVMGMDLNFRRLQKAPNKVFTAATMNGQPMFKQVFDGEKGSTTQAGQSTAMEGDTLANLKLDSRFIPERFYREFSVTPKLTGFEKIIDRLAYRVEANIPGDVQILAYFDAETGLKVRTVRTTKGGPNGEVVQTTDYEDYREVNGVKFPFLTKLTSGPQKMTFKTDTIEVNTNLSDDQFKVE